MRPCLDEGGAVIKLILILLAVIFIPIILLALGVAFINLDPSILNPANWDRQVRIVTILYASVVIVIFIITAANSI